VASRSFDRTLTAGFGGILRHAAFPNVSDVTSRQSGSEQVAPTRRAPLGTLHPHGREKVYGFGPAKGLREIRGQTQVPGRLIKPRRSSDRRSGRRSAATDVDGRHSVAWTCP
jgi:hypothetical protein